MGANVYWYIPERLDEGYGLNREALETIAAGGTRLIITVDNGISALDEIEYARTLGMDVVVTDHHQVGKELPCAAAVVNPHRRYYTGEAADLCGAGVAFKLVAALDGGDYENVLDAFGPLAAIATIGDIVPLIGENRTLVRRGLERMPYCENEGVRALLDITGLGARPLTAQKIAFGMVPWMADEYRGYRSAAVSCGGFRNGNGSCH